MNKLTTNKTKNQCTIISMYITKRNYIIVGNTWKFDLDIKRSQNLETWNK